MTFTERGQDYSYEQPGPHGLGSVLAPVRCPATGPQAGCCQPKSEDKECQHTARPTWGRRRGRTLRTRSRRDIHRAGWPRGMRCPRHGFSRCRRTGRLTRRVRRRLRRLVGRRRRWRRRRHRAGRLNRRVTCRCRRRRRSRNPTRYLRHRI